MFKIDEDGSEFTARVSNKWEYEPDEDEVIILADDEEMQGREDYCNFLLVSLCILVKRKPFKEQVPYNIKENEGFQI